MCIFRLKTSNQVLFLYFKQRICFPKTDHIGRDWKFSLFMRRLHCCNVNCAFQTQILTCLFQMFSGVISSLADYWFYTQSREFRYLLCLCSISVSGVPSVCQTQKSRHFALLNSSSFQYWIFSFGNEQSF